MGEITIRQPHARRSLLSSNNGYIIIHIWRRLRRQDGNRQSTSSRHCLGKASRPFQQGCPEAIESFGGESILEDSRALGIARRRCQTIARRYLKRRILRIEEKSAWHA